MWRLTFAILAAIWVNAALVSAQSAIPALYRLLDVMRARSAQLPAERDRSTVTIPRTWDDQAVASLQVPLAVASSSPVQIPSRYYGIVSPCSHATVLVGLRERQQVLDELERAFADRTWLMAMLKVDLVFDSLRGDLRFEGPVRRMNFPDAR